MEKRVLGMILTGVGAILIVVSVVTKMWWTAGGKHGSGGIGPLAMEECRGDRCASVDLSSIKPLMTHAGGWVVVGAFLFYFGLASLGSYGFAIYRAAMRNPGQGAKSAGISALASGAIALLAGVLFLALFPSELGHELSMSAGFPLLLVGCGGTIAGGVILLGWERQMLAGGLAGAGLHPQMAGLPMGGAPMAAMPSGPLPVTASSPGAAAPTLCPRCNTPARWIAEHSRWWCDKDAQYL